MELLKSPFLNDPSSLVAQAFAEIYPSEEYEAILVDKITAEDGTEMVGCTTFPDDGTLPLIEVAGHIPAGVGYRESAVRELEEELGVKVAPEELLYIGQNESKVDTVFYGKPFRNHETSAVYVLDRTGVSDRFILQESEVEEVKWMNFETCRECLEDPEFLNCIMGNEMDLLQRYFEEK